MRRPNIRSALSDLAFAVLALVLGWAGAPFAYLLLAFAAAAATWAWTRRAALDQMALTPRLTNSALALLMIGAVMALAYWMGTMLGGHA